MTTLAQFVARLPPGLRPSLGAVAGAQEALNLMNRSSRFAANLSRAAHRLNLSGIGTARARIGLGDLTSDAQGDVNAISNFDTSSAGSTVESVLNVAAAGYKTYQDVNKATGGGGGSSSSSASGPASPTNELAFIQANMSGGQYTGPALRWGRDSTGKPVTYQPSDVASKLVPILQQQVKRAALAATFAARAGQVATAWMAINGQWQPVPGKWSADGSHFVPNTPLPAGAKIYVAASGSSLPPTLDPKQYQLNTRTTTKGATIATPAGASGASSAVPLAAAAGAALLAAKFLL